MTTARSMKKTLPKPALDKLSDGELADLIFARPRALKIAMDRDPNIVKRARALRSDAQKKTPGRRPKPIRRLFMLGFYQDLSQKLGKAEAKKVLARAFDISEGTLSNELSRAKHNMSGNLLEEFLKLNWRSDEAQRELKDIPKRARKIHDN